MSKNKLKYEKSPYLLQHSENPVDWNAWNDVSLKLAKDSDKPIFLSVGYSTCYWCHVMERESFENDKIAKLLNKYFINIKVDREERPDLDRVYMTALQSMTGSGGWPMNMFLTPELKPFYGATYIPPKEKYGRAGFEDVIEQINELWKNRRQDIIKSSVKIFELLDSRLMEKNSASVIINSDIFEKSFDTTKNIFDVDNGGFGLGNKFPRPVVLNFLLSYYYFTGNQEALDMTTFTLKKMCEGGVYDQLGGGFHRYAVDTYWRVPHFEKMLYDQGQIASALFDTYSVTGLQFLISYGKDILEYVLNNLTDKNGGFYSAEDAESAIEESSPGYKEEGFYYLWEKEQVEKILGREKSDIFCFAYGIKHDGNTISDPHNVFRNKNVLHLANDIFDTAKEFGKSYDEIDDILSESKRMLLEKRIKRPKPHRDDKILTSWNSLMISAFAKGYNITCEKKYREAAERCCSFILENLWNKKENILYHRYRDGDVKFLSALEDYSYFIKALLDLYETAFKETYLKSAIEIAQAAISKFYDKSNSGFYDSEPGAEDIILKTKDIYDGAEPSGNAIIVENLLRLGNITGNSEFPEIAENCIKYFYHDINNMPFSSPQMLNNVLYIKNAPKEIIFTGNLNDTELKKIIKYIHGKFIPFKAFIHADKKTSAYIPYINKIVKDFENVNFYICENQSCKLPVNKLKDLKKLL
jgi:uncharacterized protein